MISRPLVIPSHSAAGSAVNYSPYTRVKCAVHEEFRVSEGEQQVWVAGQSGVAVDPSPDV